jgi:DNA mismatch repair protein MutH
MNDVGADLLARARRLAGLDLAALAARAGVGGADGVGDDVKDLTARKGFVGQWVERALGLSPRFDDVDHPESGTEVKTLPVRLGPRGARVQEGTFVTSASVETLIDETWSTSRVRRKLMRVLFVPVVSIPADHSAGAGLCADVIVGTAFLWTPSLAVETQLQRDWEDLSDLVTRGLGFAISGRRGVYLQLRPKAKDAATTTTVRTIDDDGVVMRPQGFYLRRALTQACLDEALQAPPVL